jgi:hypothetical protein
MTIEDKQELLREFLERWPEHAVRNMDLAEYIGVNNKDTFTYWVEFRMRPLGSIKGGYATKFGVFQRKNQKQSKGNYRDDGTYTWMSRLGTNSQEAFASIKVDLLNVIAYAAVGAFPKIDDIGIPNLFKWKVASLYSNERLVPIFRKETLFKIAAAYGLKTTAYTKISEIQELLISRKPADEDIYAYMDRLYDQFGDRDHRPQSEAALIPPRTDTKQRTRTGRAHRSLPKNILVQVRSVTRSYIADQKHNRIQEALIRALIAKYGEHAVLREENWVDVKLILPNEIVFYEVKAASYPYICITEALGQVLGYVFKEKDPRNKKIVVVGPYPPNDSDSRFIDFIKSTLNIDFSYLSLDVSQTNFMS